MLYSLLETKLYLFDFEKVISKKENFVLTTTAGIQPDVNCWHGLIVHVDKGKTWLFFLKDI